MRINEHWHQIMGRFGDFDLSDRHDCCVYVLDSGAGLVAFDAGSGLGLDLDRDSFAPGPSHLFLTHGHADHAGGAAAMVARSGCRTYAGRQTAGWLADPDEVALSVPAARAAGIYPAEYRLLPVRIDESLDDGDIRRIGAAEILAVATPGHSADHFAYLVTAYGRRTLVAGDSIFAGGMIVLQDTWDSSVAASCATVRKLADLRFDALLAGHGPAVLEDAGDVTALAMQRINRLLPPRNYV